MSAPRALGLGAISGLRSLSGPVFVSRAASRGDLNLDGTFLAFLSSPHLWKVLVLTEIGELVGDKLPIAPSRTTPPPLLGRILLGERHHEMQELRDGGLRIMEAKSAQLVQERCTRIERRSRKCQLC